MFWIFLGFGATIHLEFPCEARSRKWIRHPGKMPVLGSLTSDQARIFRFIVIGTSRGLGQLSVRASGRETSMLIDPCDTFGRIPSLISPSQTHEQFMTLHNLSRSLGSLPSEARAGEPLTEPIFSTVATSAGSTITAP